MTMPCISIIMPAYNAECFIDAAIASVLQQTYPHWELWIIDDASTDTTGSRILSYNDPRIHYQKITKIGHPSGVRNVGLRLAQGDFIAFLDADDVYYRDALERLLTILINHPEKTCVYGFSSLINEAGESVNERSLLIPINSGGYSLPTTYQHSWEWILTGSLSCLLSALMLRRSTFARVGLLTESLYNGEDYEYYIRLFLDNFEGVYCLPDYIYQYRIYPSSLTKETSQYSKVLDNCLQTLNWIFTAPVFPPEIQRYKAQAYARCYHYLSRERLLQNQPKLARKLVRLALRNKNITRSEWAKVCLPIFIRSLLPSRLDNALVSLKWSLKRVQCHLQQDKNTKQTGYPLSC